MANADEYKRAAQAVQSGDATKEQRELNDRMAKNASGQLAKEAQAAKKGQLDQYKK